MPTRVQAVLCVLDMMCSLGKECTDRETQLSRPQTELEKKMKRLFPPKQQQIWAGARHSDDP